jgi:hypothetical protein
MARKYKDNKYGIKIQDKVIIDLLQALSDLNIYSVEVVGETPVTKVDLVTHTILHLKIIQEHNLSIDAIKHIESLLTRTFRLFDKNIVLELL